MEEYFGLLFFLASYHGPSAMPLENSLPPTPGLPFDNLFMLAVFEYEELVEP